MNCSNCGTFNQVGSGFCSKCGQPFINNASNNGSQVQTNVFIQTPTINNNPGVHTNNQNTNMLNNHAVSTHHNNLQNASGSNNMSNHPKQMSEKVSFIGYFLIILSFILKPFTTLKEKINKFNGFKNSLILSLIVSGIATVINLLSTMWNVVRVKDFNWSTGDYTTSWAWDNLKNIKYIEVIGKNFLICIGIIFAIAIVYYLASLVVKKQVNFSKLLGISVLAVTPLLICLLVLSPIFSLIWAELGMPVIVIGAVYTVILIYEGINSELLLEGNAKYYLNLICLSILGIAMYYLYMKVFVSSIVGGLDGLDDIMNMLG